jgi:hypothetical protein
MGASVRLHATAHRKHREEIRIGSQRIRPSNALKEAGTAASDHPISVAGFCSGDPANEQLAGEQTSSVRTHSVFGEVRQAFVAAPTGRFDIEGCSNKGASKIR